MNIIGGVVIKLLSNNNVFNIKFAGYINNVTTSEWKELGEPFNLDFFSLYPSSPWVNCIPVNSTCDPSNLQPTTSNPPSSVAPSNNTVLSILPNQSTITNSTSSVPSNHPTSRDMSKDPPFNASPELKKLMSFIFSLFIKNFCKLYWIFQERIICDRVRTKISKYSQRFFSIMHFIFKDIRKPSFHDSFHMERSESEQLNHTIAELKKQFTPPPASCDISSTSVVVELQSIKSELSVKCTELEKSNTRYNESKSINKRLREQIAVLTKPNPEFDSRIKDIQNRETDLIKKSVKVKEDRERFDKYKSDSNTTLSKEKKELEIKLKNFENDKIKLKGDTFKIEQLETDCNTKLQHLNNQEITFKSHLQSNVDKIKNLEMSLQKRSDDYDELQSKFDKLAQEKVSNTLSIIKSKLNNNIPTSTLPSSSHSSSVKLSSDKNLANGKSNTKISTETSKEYLNKNTINDNSFITPVKNSNNLHSNNNNSILKLNTLSVPFHSPSSSPSSSAYKRGPKSTHSSSSRASVQL